MPDKYLFQSYSRDIWCLSCVSGHTPLYCLQRPWPRSRYFSLNRTCPQCYLSCRSGWCSVLCLQNSLLSVCHGCPALATSPVLWPGPQSPRLLWNYSAAQFYWSDSHLAQGRQSLVRTSIWSSRRSLRIPPRSYSRGIGCSQPCPHGRVWNPRHPTAPFSLSLGYLPRAVDLHTLNRWWLCRSTFLGILGCLTIRIYRIYLNRLVILGLWMSWPFSRIWYAPHRRWPSDLHL